MQPGGEINPKLLKRICWLNGLTVTALSRKIRKSRVSVYRAVKNPQRYPITHRRIQRALPKRSIALVEEINA